MAYEVKLTVRRSPLLPPATSTLMRNMDKWATRASDNYTYVFQRGCFCTDEFRRAALLTVNDDVVVKGALDIRLGTWPSGGKEEGWLSPWWKCAWWP
jgi:hypothetical protein